MRCRHRAWRYDRAAMNEIMTRLRDLVGPAGWLDAPADRAPYEKEERGLFHGKARVVVRPADTREVAAVLKFCNEHRLPVVPRAAIPAWSAAAYPTRAAHRSSCPSQGSTKSGRSIRSTIR